ncbi:sulfur carrier protein ThiS [Paracoccus aerodenitrificans]|uniref:sulfur carrier protein ThiS n=1 Tax=Paracoccus aerodenitrificans TaxID=3017781 RepID=UPI0022F01DF2|nr:sulfur carrier protein ThiS [Paracoccus aerodenitrificans]WBU64626.1 sulfur carrier protein ThiS [Paracoccus aerodenitrificans]
MKIVVNGTEAEIGATTLQAALKELGYGEARVATAVNEGFIPAAARAERRLTEGDRLEILSPKQGG